MTPEPVQITQIRQWEAGELYPEHDTFSFGHGFGAAIIEHIDRLAQERDAALSVAASSFREALTEQVYDDGQQIGSLADLAKFPVTDDTPNWRIQYGIAEALRRGLGSPIDAAHGWVTEEARRRDTVTGRGQEEGDR